MKKRMLALALVIVMILSMAGCSSGDTKKLVGTWRCEIDMTDYLMETMLADSQEMAEFISLDDVVIVYYADFKDNATACLYADEYQVADTFEQLEDDLVDALGLYMEELFYEQTGLSMTLEEILELSGTSEQDLRDSLGFDAIVQEMCDGLYMEGKYKAEEGKLHISAGLDYNIDPAMYEIYTLNGNVLTITGCVGSEIPEFNPYPMVFEKIG